MNTSPFPPRTPHCAAESACSTYPAVHIWMIIFQTQRFAPTNSWSIDSRCSTTGCVLPYNLSAWHPHPFQSLRLFSGGPTFAETHQSFFEDVTLSPIRLTLLCVVWYLTTCFTDTKSRLVVLDFIIFIIACLSSEEGKE